MAQLEVHGEVHRLPSETEPTLYRIAQEALQHTSARQVTLSLTFGEDWITLAVADDGRGFDVPDRPDALTRAGHLGIMGMRERALLLAGRSRVLSEPGQGTTMVVHFPTD